MNIVADKDACCVFFSQLKSTDNFYCLHENIPKLIWLNWEFYGPVNVVKVMSSRSVNLLTLFLAALVLKASHIFFSKNTCEFGIVLIRTVNILTTVNKQFVYEG